MGNILSFFIGYFSGSFPSAYVLGKIFKNFDMTQVGNGRIGASFSFKYLGKTIGIVVGILDFTKGFLPLLILSKIGFEKLSLLFCAIGLMLGHNWSIFIGFKGGLGAMIMYSIFLYFYPFELILFLFFGSIFYILTKNTYYSTFFIISGISFLSIFTKKDFYFFILPLILFSIMSFKKRKIKELNA